jgi:hypothetical protein
VLVGKYYLRNVDRISRDAYKITAMSAIGILDTQDDYGGLYTGQRFDAVVAGIIGNAIPYTIDSDLAAETIFGWFPIGSKRTNLHRLLFAQGATLTKDENGDIVFAFMVDNDSPQVVSPSAVYYGGSVTYIAPATKVNVIEHEFVAQNTDEEVLLFDNTSSGESVDHLLVPFKDAPVHDITASSGITVHENGVNYAIISGAGTITGKKHTHIMRTVTKSVQNPTGAERIVTVSEDLTNITAVNSENVAERMLAYYSSAKTVNAALIWENLRTGQQVSFTDPYGDSTKGYIESVDVSVSAIAKANCKIITDYAPVGQGNNFTNAILISQTGNTPQINHNGKIRIVVIGGGDGGQGGYGGYGLYNSDGTHSGSDAQNGGAGGAGGLCGKVQTVTIDDVPLTEKVFNCEIGVGGTGGAGGNAYKSSSHQNSNPTDGASGSPSWITVNGQTYSSASGTRPANGVVNLFDGNIYALNGDTGYSGGAGANASNPHNYVTDGTNTWDVGATGQSSWDDSLGAGGTGGYGGGAAIGSNGGTGGAGYYAYEYYGDEGKWTGNAGQGGSGADATAPAQATGYGQGGYGGNGGGGGGAGGNAWGGWQFFSPRCGLGGDGSDGGQGGNGCIIIYY